jgi:gliding motility-associated-like protein
MKNLYITVFFLGLTVLIKAQDLSIINNNLPKGAKSIVLTADIDIDGLPDVFIAGETVTDDFAGLYRNMGDSTFFDLGVSIPHLSDAAACFADLNNDTYADLLYTGIDEALNYRFYIYINQQNNTFLELTHTIPGIRYGSIRCSDMDHDGWQDIFISGYSNSGNIASLFKNNANQTFSKIDYNFDGLRSCGAIIADFDRNSFPDIIYTGLNESLTLETCYYQNQGDMQFVKKATGIAATQLGGMETCDVNNDGFIDLSVYGKDNTNNLIARVYQNNSGLSFTLFDELTGVREGTLKTSDFNNDGFVDVILTGINQADDYTTELYVNNAGTGFNLETDTITALGYSDALWFDFNADFKNDILVCGTTLSEAKSLILSSNMLVANQSPSVVTGLSSVVSIDTVWLSWNKGTDIETNQNGLSYDLYLESDESNTIDFKPISDPLTGMRYETGPGAYSVNSLQLNALPEGKYWWSVQSVDAAFAGSPFALADTFYISQAIRLGNDTSICFGDSIAISLQDVEGTMQWYHSLNPTTTFSTDKNIKIEITQKDTIWVVVTKDYGHQISDTIIVDVFSLPNVDIGNDVSICYGEELNLFLGADSDTVDWYTFTNIYQDSNTNNFKHSFYTNDEIYAVLTDFHGCKNSDSMSVTVRALPVIDLVNDTALCLNSLLQLSSGTVGDSINWYSLTSSIQMINSNNFEYLVSATDTFKVELFDEHRCVNYDTIRVLARLLPIADAGEDKLICKGYDVMIGPETAADDWTYFWNSKEFIMDQNASNPIVNAITDTRYFLKVTDNYGCEGTDSMLVKINPEGILDAGTNKEICIGESITLGGEPTAEGSILPYSYQWSPAISLDMPALANPIANPLETTTYSLIIFTGTCPVDTLETTVTVNLLPTITIMNDTLAGFKEDVILYATGGNEYEWSPAEFLDNPFSQNPVANLEQSTYFKVNVTNESGCSDTSGVNIFIKNEVFIPELFTPNNDGVNDYFKIYGFGIKELDLIIFDDMGVVVFQSNRPDEILNTGWNGEKDGRQVKDGKYFWKIEGEFYSGEKILFKGKNKGVLTILR